MSFSITPKPIDSVLGLLFCAIVFLISIGFTIYESIKQTRLTIYGVKTEATCVRTEMRGEGRGRTRTYIFHFKTEAGVVIEVEGTVGAWVAEVGDVIPIVYLPSDPETVSTPGIEGLGGLFIAITIAFFAGLYMLRWFL
jgi:hypothetical protein